MNMLDEKEGEEPKRPKVIHEEGGKWYFWDETWADRCGPYESREQCQKALHDYCIQVLGMTEEELKR